MFKKIIFISALLIANNVANALVSETATFTDVDSSTDYFISINWAVDRGIATGYGNGKWGPDDCVTRAQLLKMIFQASNRPEENITVTNTFKDVKSSDWYSKYVSIGYRNGWIVGYSDGTFKPNKCVNRAEAMKIATNAMFANPVLDQSVGVIMYDDKIVSDISITDWYGPFARFLFKDRLVGTNHTSFSGQIGATRLIRFYPSDSMPRKEVVEMLHRIAPLIESYGI